MQGIYQKNVKKKKNPIKRLIGWSVLLLLAVGLFKGCMYTAGVVGSLSIFNIKEITVDAPQNIKPAEILAISGLNKGIGIFKVSVGETKKKILAHPWVKEVRVRRSLPSKIKIRVSSKEVVALGRVGGTIYYIDVNGKIIDKLIPGYKADSLVLNAKQEDYPKIIALLSDIRSLGDVSDITLDSDIFIVYPSHGSIRYRFNINDTERSIKMISRVLEDLKQRSETASTIDTTLPGNKVVVKGIKKL